MMNTGRLLRNFVLAGFVSLGAVSIEAKAQGSLEIVAQVNEDIITQYDIAQRTRLLVLTGSLPNDPQVLQSVQGRVLDVLVEEKLQSQEATAANLGVNEDQKRLLLQQQARNFNLSEEEYMQRTRQAGVDRDHLVDMLVTAEIWRSFMFSRFSDRIRISDTDIALRREAIESNRSKPERHIYELFVEGGSNLKAAEAEANQLFDDIANGADFRQLALRHSDLPSAGNGGERGWLQPGRAPLAIESRLDQMAVGTVSKPFLYRNGYMILWISETRPRQQQVDGRSMVAAYRMSFPVENGNTAATLELANSYRGAADSCPAMESLVNRLGEPSEDMGTRRLGDYPAEFRQALATNPVGGASEPILHNGGQTLSIVMACSRQTNSDTGPDDEEIRLSLLNERMTNHMDNYMKDLRRNAFIEKRLSE